jgi:(4-(4-[2-(gamma-L-glutamylamino)ethyl]phenoxymethyl)furan-2-yl)methanamine synthase
MRNSGVVGWDIGGVNTKVARVEAGAVLAVLSQAYEIQRDPGALGPVVSELARRVGFTDGDRHAVTMTAELSQMFRTKRDGVAFVLDALSSSFPSSSVSVYTVDGRFLPPADARGEPLAVAASNWAATARVVAREHPNAVLVDIGTTSTDVIPIVDGIVAAVGTTDPERLASGELVYTGALRTPVEAITHHVPVHGAAAGVSAESFALIGDVHVWRGDLSPEDYLVATPDGRPAIREFAAERLARVVCADREMLDERAISTIADAVAAAQVDMIAHAVGRVRERHPSLRTAVVSGLGAFIAARAARRAGLDVVRLADDLGDDGSRCAPAVAVALLLDRAGVTDGVTTTRTRRAPNDGAKADMVVKVGGALLADRALLDTVLAHIEDAACDARIVVVPGGGPFADAVRAADRELLFADDTAHWMAVLAVDQYAHLLAERRSCFQLVSSAPEIEAALASKRVPVLAPYRWLREADPLPHSWDVTSDSISAWIAGALGASRLIVIKPPGANVTAAVDPYFSTALPASVSFAIVTADAHEMLSAELRLTSRG